MMNEHHVEKTLSRWDQKVISSPSASNFVLILSRVKLSEKSFHSFLRLYTGTKNSAKSNNISAVAVEQLVFITVMDRHRPGLELRSMGCKGSCAPFSADVWGSKSHAVAADRWPSSATSSSVLVLCHRQIDLLLILLKHTLLHLLLSVLLPPSFCFSSTSYNSSPPNFVQSKPGQRDTLNNSTQARSG